MASSEGLWPEDPLPPALTKSEMDGIFTDPELRELHGLDPLTPAEREAHAEKVRRYNQKVRESQVTCQACDTTMQYKDAEFHDCVGSDDLEKQRDLLSLL